MAKKKITAKQLAALRAHQFKKDVDGVKDPRIHRTGAPKKIVRQQKLFEAIFGIQDGEPLDESKIGLIIKALATEATTGRNKVAAAKELLDRMYGKVADKIVYEDSEEKKDVQHTVVFKKMK